MRSLPAAFALLCAPLALALPRPAVAASAVAGASATIVAPVELSKKNDLSFGALSMKAGQTVSLSPQGKLSSNGAQIKGGAAQAAVFEAQGAPGLSFSVTLPASARLVSPQSGPGQFLELRDFTAASDTAVFGSQPTRVRVGATLIAPADPQPGDYAGSFSVSVDYN